MNDDVQLALRVAADGVPRRRRRRPGGAARAALPAGSILGASCYADFDRARAAAAGADYVAFGAVHPSPTKPLAVPAPLSLFPAAGLNSVPCCAIGGIALANAAPIIAAGADMLAVISDLFAAPDVSARAHAYCQLFEEPADDDFPQPATV